MLLNESALSLYSLLQLLFRGDLPLFCFVYLSRTDLIIAIVKSKHNVEDEARTKSIILIQFHFDPNVKECNCILDNER